MAWILLALALLHCCSGGTSHSTLTQPASQSVSLGQRVKLSCSQSSGGHWNSFFAWYQQKAGQSPRLVIYYTSRRGDGIPSRFVGSASGNVAYLTITNVQPEDGADYYCADEESGSGYKFIFGGGTRLTVTGQPAVPPSVHLFPPSSDELKTKKTGTLACLVDKFYPGAVQVTWTVDGAERAAGVETTRPTKQGDAYVASSYLTLSESDWGSHDKYVCKVSHDGKSYEKSVRRSECS